MSNMKKDIKSEQIDEMYKISLLLKKLILKYQK